MPRIASFLAPRLLALRLFLWRAAAAAAMRFAFAVVASGACGACSGPLEDAEGQFKKGQYPAAHQMLLALEVESSAWNAADRGEYALYLGLTLVALGDRGRASLWLRQAKAVEDEHPGTLPYDDVRRLAVALGSNDVP